MRSSPRELGQASSQYELVARLAEGGMAEIFLARSRGMAGFARYVVLKRILPERGTDARWIEMFLDEARLVAQLQHPNIAQVFDLGRLGEGYFFTMEYVHGANMRETLIRCSKQGRQMTLSMALGVAAGAAAGLDHAHDRLDEEGKSLGIVHRDVSPSNLMLSFDGVVKLVDFGVAKAHLRSSVTQSGTVKGKISYLSPEQCRGRDVDHRSDLFALGIVLYEMATTKRLYRRGSDFETMTAIVTEEPEPPSRYNPEISPALDALILRALAKDPARRPQSAGEMLEALEDVARRDGLSISNSQLRRQMRELYGEQLEPWRALEAAPAQREAEVTYTADGLIEGSIRSLRDGEDLDSVELPVPGELAEPDRRQPLAGPAQRNVTMQLKRTNLNTAAVAEAVDPALASTFPVEVDASQVPLLDSLRAALAATSSLEQDPSVVRVAAAADDSLPSVSAGIPTALARSATSGALASGIPRTVAEAGSAGSPVRAAAAAPSARSASDAGTGPTDASRPARSLSEAITIQVVNPDPAAPAVPLPSLLAAGRVSTGVPASTAAGTTSGAASSSPPQNIWDSPMQLGAATAPPVAASTPPSGPRQPAAGTPNYTPRATLLGSAPAPIGSRRGVDSKPAMSAMPAPAAAGSPPLAPRAASGSQPLPIEGGSQPLPQHGAPVQPPVAHAIPSTAYPRAPLGTTSSGASRLPPRRAPDRRLVNGTVALVALVCLGVALGAYLALSGDAPQDAQPYEGMVDARQISDAAAVDASGAAAGPTDAGAVDAVPRPAVVDGGAVDASPLIIDEANCRKVTRTDTVVMRRACVVLLCEHDRAALARSILMSLPAKVRAELIAMYPALRPVPLPKPAAPQPEPPPAPPLCKGPLCRR